MSRPSPSPRGSRVRLLHTSVFVRSFLLSLLSICVVASSAAAASGHGPKYTLSIVEGATTLPEYEHPNFASASIDNSEAEIMLEVIHGGLVVGQDHGHEHHGADVSPGPQVGDEVVLESPRGTVISRVIYDGLPTMDATVCAGSTNFSGANTSGNVVEGAYVRKVLETPYHQPTEVVQKAFGEAQVKILSGTTFGGNFLVPLELGEDVNAVESLKTSLAGEATYTYRSENVRPVGACPAPPPPVILPIALPVLQGSLFKLLHTTIAKLLKSGWHNHVTINQPGTVTQDLYLVGGTLPAFASSTKGRHHKKPPAVLLARGSATAKSAGKVVVVVRPTKRGRHILNGAKHVKAVLITTLRSTAGVKLNLGRRTVTLHR
jgi:hypothetical protein